MEKMRTQLLKMKLINPMNWIRFINGMKRRRNLIRVRKEYEVGMTFANKKGKKKKRKF
jgi:hypothetical protein